MNVTPMGSDSFRIYACNNHTCVKLRQNTADFKYKWTILFDLFYRSSYIQKIRTHNYRQTYDILINKTCAIQY